MNENKMIKDIVLDYCELDLLGQESLDEMSGRIKQLVKVQAKMKEIASKYLSVETLDVQNSDDKDFHDLAVWDIERALIAAFEAGVVEQSTSETAHRWVVWNSRRQEWKEL